MSDCIFQNLGARYALVSDLNFDVRVEIDRDSEGSIHALLAIILVTIVDHE